ncbi:MAG TPA: hypothetical protein VJP76_05675, partial [Candidatus Tumulicola sp.]|nr:hypothetical protein [Candidatus Tumulicola sp.]
GPCSPAATHAKGQSCVSQDPPNTNPDDTLPGFALSTFPEAYLAYKRAAVSATIGDQMFDSPWAAPYDGSRLKPAAYQGAAVKYAPGGWTFELADMLQFESRTNNAFESATLLTSHPAGAAGVPDDIYVPGGGSITTAGFLYARAGFADSARGYAFNGYVYAVSDIVTMWWIDGRYELSRAGWKPFVAVQGGLENDNGAAVIGKIRSSVAGIRLGATPARDVAVDLSADTIPWRSDTLRLPAPVTCSNSSHQIAAGAKVYPGTTFAYFLPVDAAQCVNNPGGTATVYYGGWASPYTDSYSADPLFTTQITQGMADRRSPGFSWRLSATYTSPNRRVVFIAGDAWFDYGNALAAQVTNEWTLDGQYHFSPVAHDRYRGLLLRYRYAQREQSNAQELGGLPLFKYNRAQMEYDF